MSSLDGNYNFFLTQLPSLLDEHRGEYALVGNEVDVEIYPSVVDALLAGEKKYEPGCFVVQEIVPQTPLFTPRFLFG